MRVALPEPDRGGPLLGSATVGIEDEAFILPGGETKGADMECSRTELGP